MTFSAVPFALQNGSHSADLFRQAVSSLVPPGGGVVTAGDLAVTQTGTPSMNVSIGVGRIWIPGTNVGNVAGGNFSSQAMYYGQNDSAFTASVTTSDPINPRIDVVYAAVTDSQYAGITNAGTLAVVAGVPTSGATYPTNAPAIPSNAKAVAWITVPANASSILNANITQLAVAGLPAVPKVRASAAVAGSATNLLSNLTNNAVTPITQCGTYVGVTDGAGNIAITYPVAFPNGLMTAVAMSGDSAAGGNGLTLQSSADFTQTTSTLYLKASTSAGPKISSTLRFNWIAIGW